MGLAGLLRRGSLSVRRVGARARLGGPHAPRCKGCAGAGDNGCNSARARAGTEGARGRAPSARRIVSDPGGGPGFNEQEGVTSSKTGRSIHLMAGHSGPITVLEGLTRTTTASSRQPWRRLQHSMTDRPPSAPAEQVGWCSPGGRSPVWSLLAVTSRRAWEAEGLPRQLEEMDPTKERAGRSLRCTCPACRRVFPDRAMAKGFGYSSGDDTQSQQRNPHGMRLGLKFPEVNHIDVPCWNRKQHHVRRGL